MSAETRIGYLAVLHLQVDAQFIAADGVAVFVRNIGVFERAVIARVLIGFLLDLPQHFYAMEVWRATSSRVNIDSRILGASRCEERLDRDVGLLFMASFYA